jgi:ElaB/YqjD/DUF883 family membrane-anchored ribosome-binding protein
MVTPMYMSKKAEIEAALARDRAELSASLGALNKRVSPPNLTDAFSVLKNTSIPARAIESVAKGNPLMLAAAGAGLAYYLWQRRASEEALSPLEEAKERWEDEGGLPLDEVDMEWVSQAETLRARAEAIIADLEARARSGLAAAADVAQAKAEVISDLARDVRKSMRHGIEHLSESAQARILAAREAAYEAQLNLRKQASEMVQEHPLAATGGALALGMAIAAIAFPRRSAVARRKIKERDRLLAETRRTLREERRRAAEAMDILARS